MLNRSEIVVCRASYRKVFSASFGERVFQHQPQDITSSIGTSQPKLASSAELQNRKALQAAPGPRSRKFGFQPGSLKDFV